VTGAVRTLIVTHERREALERELETYFVQTVSVRTDIRALSELRQGSYDCVIVDNLDVCRRIREVTDVPVIVLAGSSRIDPVIALELGADDCVATASTRELAARIRAQARRYRRKVGPTALMVRDLTLDLVSSTVLVAGTAINVTRHEFAILRVLAERPGEPLSRAEILRATELTFERSIDIHVSRLRVKLGDDAYEPRRLRTVRGAGYVLE
jgi:two-component system, OmpR family, response regulator